MPRRAEPSFASLAVSCYTHSIFSAWLQISDHFLLAMTRQERCQQSEVLFAQTMKFLSLLPAEAPVQLLGLEGVLLCVGLAQF